MTVKILAKLAPYKFGAMHTVYSCHLQMLHRIEVATASLPQMTLVCSKNLIYMADKPSSGVENWKCGTQSIRFSLHTSAICGKQAV